MNLDTIAQQLIDKKTFNETELEVGVTLERTK